VVHHYERPAHFWDRVRDAGADGDAVAIARGDGMVVLGDTGGCWAEGGEDGGEAGGFDGAPEGDGGVRGELRGGFEGLWGWESELGFSLGKGNRGSTSAVSGSDSARLRMAERDRGIFARERCIVLSTGVEIVGWEE